jgi:Ni/Co efflux regulator RcnB
MSKLLSALIVAAFATSAIAADAPKGMAGMEAKAEKKEEKKADKKAEKKEEKKEEKKAEKK